MSIDIVVERYVKLRDRKAELKKAYEKSVEDIDTGLTKLENYLLKQMQEQGAESVRTNAGTAYISKKASATVSDKDAFKNFLAGQDDPFAFIDLKANKPAIEEYSKEHQDVPPGINWTVINAVGVRRA